MQQITDTFLMIRPKHFGFNEETTSSNSFQKNVAIENVNVKAVEEFDAVVAQLRSNGIAILVYEDNITQITPDSIFPNNWLAVHPDKIFLFPMLAANRRLERRLDIVSDLQKQFQISELVDLSDYEIENKFLEGTGSIVFDHLNKIAYASISERTNEELFAEFCESINYQPVTFHAINKNNLPVYHTNVVMCVGENFVVICMDAITNATKKTQLSELFFNTGHEVISITMEQMECFAGNMMQTKNELGQRFVICSETAYKSLTSEQKSALKNNNELIICSIPTIERVGGGGIRCMLAEIYH